MSRSQPLSHTGSIIKLAPKHVWSEYQKAIFEDIASNREGHLIVDARAGSGKSTTLIESFKHAPKTHKILALAFNKAIAQELKERAPSYVVAATFHSWGLRAIKQRHKTVQVDTNKTFDIVKSLVEDETDYNLIGNVCDTVAFCKYGLQDTPRQIEDLIYRFGIDLCDLDLKAFISVVIRTLGLCKTKIESVDYDDMCSLPFALNLPFERFDLIAVDEYQDLNLSQLVMAKRSLKPNGRLAFYGDPEQSLYSWRLSDTSVITEVRAQPTTKVLPLPVSYRCPKEVIALAQRWVPDITCPDTAIDGEIHDISYEAMFEKAKPGCFVLSRTNAPLIKLAMRFVREGKACNIRGRDIGAGLAYLIRKSKKQRMDAFLTWLDKWLEDETKVLVAKGISTENLMDKYECIRNLCEEHKTLEEVLKQIDVMFSDKSKGELILASTVHRAKGDQAYDVFVLRWTFQLWLDESISLVEKPNEAGNIAYVSASRCIKRLFIVSKF